MENKMINEVKHKLSEGKVAFGPWVHIGHPDIAEILSLVGFDFVIYDTEHTPLSLESIQNMMQVMHGSRVVPLVRVAWNDPVLIKRVLDLGTYGVFIPWVNKREEAERAVEACRYAPKGIRGCSPRRASQYGLNFRDYFERFAQEEILIIVQIETKEAIENLDEILSVDGIDVAFVGPLDLSVSLGVPKQWDAPILKNSIQKIVEKCKQYNVVAGIDVQSVEDAKRYIEQGFQFITFSSDTDFLLSAAKNAYARLGKLS